MLWEFNAVCFCCFTYFVALSVNLLLREGSTVHVASTSLISWRTMCTGPGVVMQPDSSVDFCTIWIVCLFVCLFVCLLAFFPYCILSTYLAESQWSNGNMPDCGVWGPRFESHRWQLCLSRQPLWYTALCTGCTSLMQCLGRLSLPPSAGQ